MSMLIADDYYDGETMVRLVMTCQGPQPLLLELSKSVYREPDRFNLTRGGDSPEEQQSWQVESVSLTPQHSAAKPRRVMYDLHRRIARTQAPNLTPMRMRRTRR